MCTPARDKKINKTYSKKIIHNFSTYVLSPRETECLSYSLDHSIPSINDTKKLEVEFESFYQQLSNHTTNLSEFDKNKLKTKTLSIFHRYNKTKIQHDDEKVIKNLIENKNICILKQDKGKGVVIVNRTDYFNKCLNLIDNDKFKKLDVDPTKKLEGQIQRALRKIKSTITEKEYRELYPQGSKPAQFYGTAKVHKVPVTSKNVNDLPLRPIISNIGTATYKTSKYLSKLLTPLTKSSYSVSSSKEFIDTLKLTSIRSDYVLVSFDVASLFTNVPLDETINIIMRKIFRENRIETKIPEKDLRSLLTLCTKHVHFSFNGTLYTQMDGVAMGSPLGPVLANIFMVELEEYLMPKL